MAMHIADPVKILWIRPECIRYKLPGRHDSRLRPGDVLDGDWDLQRVEFDQTLKYVSMVQHFSERTPWGDTVIFRKSYSRRFDRGEKVLGTGSMVELNKYYEERIDPLYEDMRVRGFVIQHNKRGVDYRAIPHVHIGRDGEFLYGTRGNHRLSIAKLLNLSAIACQVRARHSRWQELRQKVADYQSQDARRVIDEGHVGHPDLDDLIFSRELSKASVL